MWIPEISSSSSEEGEQDLGLAWPFLLSLLDRPPPVRPSTISRINLNLTRKVLHMTYQARLMQASRRTMEKRIVQTLKMMSRANEESIFDLHYRTGKRICKCKKKDFKQLIRVYAL